MSVSKVPNVIGMTEKQATELLTKSGFTVRLRQIDGRALMGTTEIDDNRVNLYITAGKVTKATVG